MIGEGIQTRMIDTANRRHAAHVIDDFVRGRITNFEFDDRYPQSNDKVIRAIYMAMWASLYDDTYEHRLVGAHQLSDASKTYLNRCVLFLNTDMEYTGPENNLDFSLPFRRLWNWLRRKQSAMDDANPSWPFDNETQLQDAAAHAGVDPKGHLCGNSAQGAFRPTRRERFRVAVRTTLAWIAFTFLLVGFAIGFVTILRML